MGHLVLAREFSRYNVIKAIEAALDPHRARSFTIHGLGYGPTDSYPPQRMPERAYVTWEHIKLDNAKANLATETLLALCERVGCRVAAGPKNGSDERSNIERFFGAIVTRLFSCLPGYIGNHLRDLRCASSDLKGNLHLLVSLDEL